MKVALALLVFGSIFFGCNKKEEKSAKSSLAVEMKTFRVESSGGCKSDTLECASYTIEYPAFTGLSDAVIDSLKKKIAQAVDTGNPDNDTLSFESAGRLFIKDFESTRAEFPDGVMGWYFNATVLVNILSDSLVSLTASNESFTGGAHEGYGTYFINVNPLTGQNIKLGDVLKPGYEEDLRKAGEEAFRKSVEMNDSVSYADLGFEFANDKFKLNDNYGFNATGIVFVFNIYEIGPFVLGTQMIEIPYDKIKNWLK